VGAAVFVLCATAAALMWRVLPPQQDVVSLPGISAPIGVAFDGDGIPFIRAASATDAAAALGYIHARDRLFQMDLMRRAAGGTLAELFGPAALPNDREMRLLGVRRSAEADVADLSPAAKAMLQAYADGVNAWITRRGRFAAPEFVFLGKPPHWSIVDSLLWGKTMSLWLSGNWREQLQRLALSGKMPRAKIDALWPPVPGMLPEIASLEPALPRLAAAAAETLRWTRHFPQPFTQPAEASNEWAVSGAHTASGRPLLAGDPHLAFGFPSLWYLARIDTPSGAMAGATAPGLPFMVIGHNDRVAWTFTTTGAAVQDVFIEHRTADGHSYETPDGPKPFVMRTEHISVRGHKDEVLTIAETRHGPIIGSTSDGGSLLAVDMANLSPHDTDADGLLMLDRARNMADVGLAAAHITSPVQNLLAADIANHIGFFTTGRVPIRHAGDGAWPVDGADGKHDWIGFASGVALPHGVDPRSGRLVNANEPTVGPDFPIFLTRDTHGDWRARRIRALLEASERQSVLSFSVIQADVTSDFAAAELPRLRKLKVPAGDPAAKAAALLENWAGEMTMDRPQPLIFTAWNRAIIALILRENGISEDEAPIEENNFLLSLLGPQATTAAQAMWCGGDCNPILLAALDGAMRPLRRRYGDDPAAWRWGAAHPAIFAHPLLSRLPLIGALGRLSIPVPGDNSTIDLSAPAPTDKDPHGFTAVHGPELRAIYDLSDLDESRFVIAPGQSGNLLDSHTRDLLLPWREGLNLQLGPEPNEVSRQIRIMPISQSP
jgi:penicillin G amidase